MKYLPLLLIFLYSCSTTKKVKSVTKTEERSSVVSNSDSAVKKTVDSVSVKKDNSVTTFEKSDDYEKETVIEFGKVVINPADSIYKTPAADYFPPITKITIREKGVKKEKSSIQLNILDSTSVKKELVIVVTTTREVTYYKKSLVKNKDVKRTGLSLWVYIGGGIAILIYAAGIYFRLWPWHLGLIALFRKKKEQYNNITYNKKNKL